MFATCLSPTGYEGSLSIAEDWIRPACLLLFFCLIRSAALVGSGSQDRRLASGRAGNQANVVRNVHSTNKTWDPIFNRSEQGRYHRSMLSYVPSSKLKIAVHLSNMRGSAVPTLSVYSYR
jgi:hypothetical protein